MRLSYPLDLYRSCLLILIAAFAGGCSHYRSKVYMDTLFNFPKEEQAFVDELLDRHEFPITLREGYPVSQEKLATYEKRILKLLGLTEDNATNLNIQRIEKGGFASVDLRPSATMQAFALSEAKPLVVERVNVLRVRDVARQIRRGKEVEGVKWNKETRKLSYHSKSTTSLQIDPDNGSYYVTVSPEYLSIVLTTNFAKEGREAKHAHFDELLKNRQTLIQLSPLDIDSTLIHEGVESVVVYHFIKSDDRRWFCDGVAEVASALLLQEDFPEKTTRDILHEIARPRPSDLIERLDEIQLEAWPASENGEATFSNGHYYMAALAILKMIEAHGAETLTELFNRLQEYDYESTTMDTVYHVFHNLTGEDLRVYIQLARQEVLNTPAKLSRDYSL